MLMEEAMSTSTTPQEPEVTEPGRPAHGSEMLTDGSDDDGSIEEAAGDGSDDDNGGRPMATTSLE